MLLEPWCRESFSRRAARLSADHGAFNRTWQSGVDPVAREKESATGVRVGTRGSPGASENVATASADDGRAIDHGLRAPWQRIVDLRRPRSRSARHSVSRRSARCAARDERQVRRSLPDTGRLSKIHCMRGRAGRRTASSMIRPIEPQVHRDDRRRLASHRDVGQQRGNLRRIGIEQIAQRTTGRRHDAGALTGSPPRSATPTRPRSTDTSAGALMRTSHRCAR